MSRTNIDIDDVLVTTVVRRYGLRTKKEEAVDLALRRLDGVHAGGAPRARGLRLGRRP